MINGKTILAFIPARSGSKSVPRKNIRKLGGKELIGYTIEAAQKTDICDKILVSTDSSHIAEIAQKFGAETPFIRPDELATDSAPMIEVIKHGMRWIETKEEKYDIFLYLQPTSPFRKATHINSAIQKFFKKDAESIVSVNKINYIPGRINTLPEEDGMNKFIDTDSMHKNRQELAQYYELNGAIDLIQWEVMKNNWNWYGEKSYPYIIPQPYCLDIDTKMDFKFAQFLLKEEYVKI